MSTLREQFTQFAEKHAAFIDSWGNWIIVSLFVVILAMFLFSLTRIKSLKLKVWVIAFLLLLLFFLTFFAVLLSQPVVSQVIR